MSLPKKLLAASMACVLVACTLPVTATPSPSQAEDAVALAVKTVQAQLTVDAAVQILTQAAAVLTAQAQGQSPQLTLTPTSQPTGVPSATPELAPTSGSITVSVSQDSNCRAGPGTQYQILGVLHVGQTALVVGKNTANGYWIIQNPDAPGQCWLWGKFATTQGDPSTLSEMTPPPPPPTATFTPVPPTATTAPAGPPTPTVNPIIQLPGFFKPAAPSNLQGSAFCQSGLPVFFVMLTWQDNSSNESGFRVYRDGKYPLTLAANTTSYKASSGSGVLFGVEAYNSFGASSRPTAPMVYGTCPS